MLNRRLNGALACGLIAIFLLIHPIAAFATSSFIALSQTEAALSHRNYKTRLFNKDAEGKLPEGRDDDAPSPETNTDKFRGGATPPPLPTMSQYIKFALPCLGLWIAQPLLSLVDTSFVGLSSGGEGSARQLAALGPATTFFDGATYLFAFLNVATTNLYSSAKAEKGIQSDKAESVVRTSSRVAFRCGLGIMTFLLIFSRPLLELYMGSQAAATPGLLDSATDYVKIRALSLPTSLLLGVLQAALLGAQDSVTPLIAIVYCTVVNVVMDYVLVSRVGWGLQGAAIATTCAQWAATAALIPAAKRKLLKTRKLELWKRSQPGKDGVTGKTFLSFAAPVLTLILGKLAAYGFMTNTAAGVPGQPIPLAAHQIILSLLFACAPFLEVLSQTAQTFLPQYLAPARKLKGEAAEPWIAAGQKVATNLLGMSVFIAGGVASLAALVPAYFGNWITTDTVVQKAIQPMAKYLWFGAFIWAPIAVSEGVLLGRLQLGFLATIYLLSTALLPPALLQIKFRGGSVEHVWAAFCVFQLFRALTFTGRIWGGYALRRKPKRASAKA